MTARDPRNVYCCVDVEASGPVPGLFDLVSIGAVGVLPQDDGRHAVVADSPFYVELAPQGGQVDPGAMAVHGITSEHLREHGRPLGEALQALTDWARSVTSGTRQRLVFVGHNAPFDWSYVNHAYHVAELANPFGWKALDTKALAMGVLGLDWFDTNKENLERLLPDLPPQDAAQVHRADYDATYQAHILQLLLDHGAAND